MGNMSQKKNLGISAENNNKILTMEFLFYRGKYESCINSNNLCPVKQGWESTVCPICAKWVVLHGVHHFNNWTTRLYCFQAFIKYDRSL